MTYHVETDREADGRWIAEVKNHPGCIAYGCIELIAVHNAVALAIRAQDNEGARQREE